ncbi:unnamed protein product [Clonostachys rhizophaga]|uniref:DUF1754-domain-containing protein n=2 Tax=Clonostachys TaxID=110564 RepID=A0A9N9V6N6_9HYPO|nr:unnamed protein product [Clonostachys byssicola]CAH0017703.1 unnamed protein product [Clonostachys rhizophaga]
MPSDDYAAAGGGGALRIKGAKVTKKKKKNKNKTDLEKNLSAGEGKVAKGAREGPAPAEDVEEDEAPNVTKTEAELRYDEFKKKRLLKLAESNTRPELLKTHKERVEDLNTYLSKLSEHHDMPKIGPG